MRFIAIVIVALLAVPAIAHLPNNASVDGIPCQITYASSRERAFTAAPWLWAAASTLLATVLVWKR
ncbi:hypothetical protein HY642_03365 [Candidatus Woesearchaeota archaeon]|nr:hypothetical protein [Candidatus Woesearchaeota archaeon]